MNIYESVTSVAGIAGILGAMYLQVIDGLKPEVTIAAIFIIGGLGGYKALKDYLELRGGK